MKKTLMALALASAYTLSLAGGYNGGGHDGGGGQTQGPKGDTGPQGPKGDTGAPGRDGKDGKNGVDGAKGDTGATGATGAAGKNGVDGKNGTNGTNGTNGKDGVGIAGKDGAAGTAGKDGATGAQGPQGLQGVAPPDTATVQDVTNAVQASAAQTGQQMSGLRDEIHRVGKNAYAGVAVAMALQMPALNPYKPDALTMRAGVGAFKGQGAVGISFRKGNKAGDWSVSGGVAHSHAGTGFALGVEHSF